MRKDADTGSDRIGAHRYPADAVNLNSQISGHSLYQFPTDATDEYRSPRILSCLLGINVEITLCARSEDEISQADGFVSKELP